jgi:hypothetical protein
MALNSPNDPYRTGMTDDAPRTDRRSPSQLDRDLQMDPELTEGGPVSGSRIAAFAVAIVLVFAAVFYGMNATSTDPGKPSVATQTTPPSQNNAPTPPNGQANNAQPGVTTGAAPANPQNAPPTGAEVNRPAGPK